MLAVMPVEQIRNTKMPANPYPIRLCGHASEHMRNKNRQNTFQRHLLLPCFQNTKKKKSLKIKDFLLVAPI